MGKTNSVLRDILRYLPTVSPLGHSLLLNEQKLLTAFLLLIISYYLLIYLLSILSLPP